MIAQDPLQIIAVTAPKHLLISWLQALSTIFGSLLRLPLPCIAFLHLPPQVKGCCSVLQWCPTLQCHELQHTRIPCPSLFPGVCSSSCPLNQWCYLTISSSTATFSFCLQSSMIPASGSFPMSRLFPSGGQSIGASTSASVHWSEYSRLISFRIDWFDFLAVQGTLKHHSLIALILRCSASFLTSTHKYWKKNIALTIWPFVGNVLNVQCQIWYESWLLSQLPSFWLSYLQNQIRFLACIMGGSHNAPGSCPGMKQPWWKVRLTSMGVQAHSSPIFLRQSMKVMAVHLHDL